MNTEKEKRAVNIRTETGCKGQKTQKKSAFEAYFSLKGTQAKQG